MISAFEVYLVFQLDSICTFLGAIVGGLCCSITFFIVSTLCTKDHMRYDEGYKRDLCTYARRLKKSIAAAIVVGFIAGLVPNSKTAAAMIILPALTSDKVVAMAKPELREFLELTKEALRNIGGKKEKVEK